MPAIIVVVIVLFVVVVIARTALGQKTPANSPTWSGMSAPQAIPQSLSQNGVDALADLATCARPRGPSDMTAVVQVKITDGLPADWHLDFAQGQCTLVQGISVAAPVSASASSHVWRELAAKRISFASAFMKGSILSEGDTAILMRLDDALSGPVDPSRRSLTPTPAIHAEVQSPSDNSGTMFSSDSDRQTSSLTAGGASGENANSPDAARAALLQAVNNLQAGASREQQIDAIRAAFAGMSPEHQKEAISAALSHGEVLGNLQPGALPPQKIGQIQSALAVRAALVHLPPGATAAQKREAVRAALGGLAPGHDPAASQHGIGEHLTDAVVGGLAESILEGLLGGG